MSKIVASAAIRGARKIFQEAQELYAKVLNEEGVITSYSFFCCPDRQKSGHSILSDQNDRSSVCIVILGVKLEKQLPSVER